MGTTVQKTLRHEVLTLYTRFSTDASSNPTITTANGASKGIKSIIRIPAVAGSPSIYVVTVDDSIVVQAQLGCPYIEQIRTNVGNALEARFVTQSPLRVFTLQEIAFTFYDVATGSSSAAASQRVGLAIPISTIVEV